MVQFFWISVIRAIAFSLVKCKCTLVYEILHKSFHWISKNLDYLVFSDEDPDDSTFLSSRAVVDLATVDGSSSVAGLLNLFCFL